jgi:hypothetical protein
MDAFGWGVETNLIEPHAWFELAASNGLEIAARNRTFLADMLTVEDIAEAKMRALVWAERHR